VKYAFVRAHHPEFRVKRMCEVLQISRSGYYDWHSRAESERRRRDQVLLEEIRKIHRDSKEAYGAIKTWKRLRQTGATQLIEVAVPGTQADEIWMADVTFIPTRAGWLYLAVLIDLYTRLVVGWSMTDRPNQELVNGALLMAIEQRKPKPGLIHHSDQGILYACASYLEVLQQYGMLRSMSGKGNCYDNAVVESFFSSLKNEIVHHQDYHTRDQARTEIFEYIELFYNQSPPFASITELSNAHEL
jgi:putative transposase